MSHLKTSALGCLLLVSACLPSLENDLDGGLPTDGGLTVMVDAGTPSDGGLQPLALDFVPFTFPVAPAKDGFVSDGTNIFSTVGATLEFTSDLGHTWQSTTQPSGQLAFGPNSTAYVFTSQGALYASTDGAQTFTPRTMLPDVQPNSLLSTTTDGSVWLYTQTLPPHLYRSTNQGMTFSEVALPAQTTVLRRCASYDGTFVASRNAMELIRFDGSSWQTLGPAAGVGDCIVTPSGTVIANGYDSASYQARFFTDGGAPEHVNGLSAAFYRRQGSDIIRFITSGRLDRTSDEGATWVPQVTSTPNGFAVNTVAVSSTGALAASTQGLAELTNGSTAWHVIENPGLPIFLRVVDLSFSLKSPAIAMLLDDNIQRTLYYSADGIKWARGLTFDQINARAIAVSPTGDRIFVGGGQGSYRIVTDGGQVESLGGTLGNDVGFVETNPVQQAVWDGDATSSVIVVSTAKDDDTSGELLSVNPDGAHWYWQRIKPTQTTTQLSWRPGGYHGLAMSPSGGTLNRRLFSSFRTWVSTNSWSVNFVVWNRAFDSQAFWEDSEPPIAFSPALAASYSPLGPLAVLWSEGRLRVGQFTFGLREVPTGNQLRTARVVRFSRDGRLWLGTAEGLFKTAQPVTGL